MSVREIDDYLANLEEPKRTTLQKLRQTILSIIPQAEQGIAYGCPALLNSLQNWLQKTRPNFVSLARAPLKPPDANPGENDRVNDARQQGPPGIRAPCRRLHRTGEQRRHRPT